MRKIIAYKDYYSNFINKLGIKEREKVMRALLLFADLEVVPYHYIKYLRDDIYEFRVNYGNNEFRIFFTYDSDTLVILFNAFKKKSQKTPKKEIDKAIRLKEEYYENKR
jgi:phage-related protein